MTDISINAGLTASLIPQTPSVNQTSAFEFEPVQGNSFYDALQGTSSVKAANVSSPAAAQSVQSTESVSAPQNAAVSQSTAEQNGYAQRPAAANSSAAEADYESVSQTVPAYDSYGRAEGITVNPETVEELASLLAEKANIPSAYEQAKQALEAAMLKAINDMNDPELQEEEAKEKLLLALMKFLEKLNGEPEKETALDDGDKDKEFQGVLMEIVEHLIESARKQKNPDSDLDGNVPVTDLVLQPEPIAQLDFKKVETKPLTGLNQLRSDNLLKERFPSLSRARAEQRRQPIPVPIDPRKGIVSVEGVAEGKAELTVQASVSDGSIEENLQTVIQLADNVQAVTQTDNSVQEAAQTDDSVQTAAQTDDSVQAVTQPADNLQTAPDIPDENTSEELIGAVQDPIQTGIPEAPASNADEITVSEAGTQQTQSISNVRPAANVVSLKNGITVLDGVGPVEKVQDSEFAGTGGGIFVIEFLPNSSNGLTGTVLGWENGNVNPVQPATDDLSNAPANPETSGELNVTIPVQDQGDLETDITSDNSAGTVYAPDDEESISPDIPVKETESISDADNAEQLPDGEEAMYEKLAENVYAEVYKTFKKETADQIQQVQPVNDLTQIPKKDVSDRTALSDELDELSRLFGIKKEPEVKDPPIDDENPDKVNEISKETPVEKISVVSSKVPDAPQVTAVDSGESGIKQVVTQIVTEIMHNLPQKDGETTLMMTLNPESLGRISIKLVENAGKLSVSIVAENKETAAMLASRYENIQESLRDNGTQLEKYQVVYGAEQDGRAEQQNYDGSSKNPYVRQDEEHDEGNDGQFRELLEEAV